MVGVSCFWICILVFVRLYYISVVNYKWRRRDKHQGFSLLLMGGDVFGQGYLLRIGRMQRLV